jgi:hypothetical protein
MSTKHGNSPAMTEAKKQVETKITPVQITCVSSSYGMPLPERSISYSVDASVAAKENAKK